MRKQSTITLFFSLLAALVAMPAMATTITVTEYQTLTGFTTAYPNDVSGAELVGVVSNTSGDKAVIWRDSATAPELLLPAASLPVKNNTVAMAMNSDGTIVGNELNFTPGAAYTAIFWTRNADNSYGAAEVLTIPPDVKNGHTEEINDNGEIVGTASVIGQIGQIVPLLWRPNGTGYDTAEELQRLAGSSICNANDINNQGVITGTCGATAVKWIPSSGVYGAPVALTGTSGLGNAINDGNVVVGGAKGDPAKWSAAGALTFPFGKLGGNAVDVNNDSWILAKKSTGSAWYLNNGATTNLSTLLASQIAGFSSGGFGGQVSNNDGGIVRIAVGANVVRTGYRGNVPVVIQYDLNN